MKIGKEHIGKKIKNPETRNIWIVHAISSCGHFIWVEDVIAGFYSTLCNNDGWQLVEEKQLMAPAICRDECGYYVCSEIYSSEKEAKEVVNFVSWPAVIDKETGFYIVPKK